MKALMYMGAFFVWKKLLVVLIKEIF